MATSSKWEGNIPTMFGAFYPTGHIVIIFAHKGAAEKAREALFTGGYEEDEIVILTSDQVIAGTEYLNERVNFLANLGSELRHMQEHLELAKQGCDKMIVHAPTEHETKRVMNVARRFDIKLAEKYHRLVIEHLVES